MEQQPYNQPQNSPYYGQQPVMPPQPPYNTPMDLSPEISDKPEHTLNVLARVIFWVGIVLSALFFVLGIIALISGASYHHNYGYGYGYDSPASIIAAGGGISLIIMSIFFAFMTILAWAQLRVLSNISLTTKAIRNKIH